ncbi:phosphohydrolase [Erythrobacter litoralis]|uniref:metallophosphoesterase n=1 Tax=Erythrobacter litoralis TaxID=39960 RepID=UPI002435EC87|nr:metallophosphoesterase [Erythrobacter litoralis]MDG6079338.1 phosphohydrolase [Erythrobacter litoralis]
MRRNLGLALLAALALGIGLLALGYSNARADPIVRKAYVPVSDWPDGVPPLRVLALSDVHVSGPDMPPERVVRIAERLNRLSPDLILIAGDLISEKGTATKIYTEEQVAAPFAAFKARYGMIVAPGNHDHWVDLDAMIAALETRGITVLRNEAVRRGPVRIGAVDDDYTGHDDIPATFAALDALGTGPTLIVSHTPDIVPGLPRPVSAIFAGHTHCGQISLPVIGPIATMSRYGDRFACGKIRDGGQTVFVGAGLGTSILPLRLGAPPDVWLVTFGPPR